jgi:hypothetical protein
MLYLTWDKQPELQASVSSKFVERDMWIKYELLILLWDTECIPSPAELLTRMETHLL